MADGEEIAFVKGVEKVFTVHFLYDSLFLSVGSPFGDFFDDFLFQGFMLEFVLVSFRIML